jgi:CubicO group peptidase (beta-lactamase class C family)
LTVGGISRLFTRMSPAPRTSKRVDPNDPIPRYIITSPDPVASVSDYNVKLALNILDLAAGEATREVDGTCWTPGLSIVVVGRGEELLCKGYGRPRVGTPGTIGPETLFPCASLSKPVSATLLAHAGVPQKLGSAQKDPWAVPVGYSLVDEFDRTTELNTSLRQWLSHRSGLPDHAGDLIEDLNPSLPQDALFTCLLTQQSGIDTSRPFNYTNFGFTMGCLGAMKKIAPEPSWEDASARWLDELGMTRSTYRFTPVDHDAKGDRAFPHVGQPERTTALLEVDPTGWTWRVASCDQERDPTLQAPAGSLISCARDLGRLLIALLTTEYLEFPPKNPPPEDLANGHPYSLGWNVRNPGRDNVSFSHSGAFRLGAGTSIRFDPLSGFGVAVLSNGEPTGVPEALTALFFNQLYGSRLPSVGDFAGLFAVVRPMMLEQIYPTKINNYERYHARPSEVPGGLPSGQIVFNGYSPYYASSIVIERKGTDLVLKLGDAGQGLPLWEFPLRCIDKATLTFIYDTRGENEVGPSAIRLVQENGAIVRVVDEWLNSSGPRLGEIAASGHVDA